MAAPMNAPLAPYFTVTEGYTIRFAALNPTTGAEVAGVAISDATVSLDRGELTAPNPPLEPFGHRYFATNEPVSGTV